MREGEGVGGEGERDGIRGCEEGWLEGCGVGGGVGREEEKGKEKEEEELIPSTPLSHSFFV